MKNVDVLAVAIVGQACKDYEEAFQKHDWKALKELQDWFQGPEFEDLNLSSDGAALVDMMNDRLSRHGKLSAR